MLKKDVSHFRPIAEYACAEAEHVLLLSKAAGNGRKEGLDKVHSSCSCEPGVLSR